VGERADGSLLIIPDDTARADIPRRSAPGDPGLLGALLRRTPPRSMQESLEAWGVVLLDGETVSEFGIADVNDCQGFLALTSRRLLFLARARGALQLADERPLSSISHVEPGRRGRRRWLTVTWEASAPMTIAGPDRDALERLEAQLRSVTPGVGCEPPCS